jgi:hypothetical protein
VEARRALRLDPDNPMASHLVMRMAEILRARGDALPEDPVQTATKPDGRPGLVDRVLRRGRR